MKMGKPAAIQVVYNYLHRDAAEELFARAEAEGVGIIAREPLANGFLTGKYTKDSVFPVGDIRHQWPSKYQAQLVNQIESFGEIPLWQSPLTPTQSAIRLEKAQPPLVSTYCHPRPRDRRAGAREFSGV